MYNIKAGLRAGAVSYSGHQHITLGSNVVTSANELPRMGPQKVYNNSNRWLPYGFQEQWVLLSAGFWLQMGIWWSSSCLPHFFPPQPPHLAHITIR